MTRQYPYWRQRARRAAYLFSPNDTTSTFPGDCNDMEPVSSPPEPWLVEDTACTAASVIYHRLVDTPTCMNIVSNWGDTMDGDAADSPSPYVGASWNPNLPEALLVRVKDVLQELNGARQHFQLLFLLPTLAYCSSHPQTAFLSMLLAFTRKGQYRLENHADHNLLDGYFAHGVVLKLEEEISRALWEALPASSPCSFPHLQFMPGDILHPSLALQHTHQHSGCPITLGLLLSTRVVPALLPRTNLPQYNSDGDKYPSSGTPAFSQLLSSLRVTERDPRFQRQYITHLHSSALHVRKEYQTTGRIMIKYPIEELKKHFLECRRKWMDALDRLKGSLSATTADPLEQTLARCGQWPPVTPYSLLGFLASSSLIKLSKDWKMCLVQFALLLLELQRARRLLRFALAGLEDEFSKELKNAGCKGWDAEQYPDWLLVQVRSRSLSMRV